MLLFFENLSRKFKYRHNLDRITSVLHEDVCTFVTISRSVIRRTENLSDKFCRENQNIFFVFFSKVVPFMRKCGKMW